MEHPNFRNAQLREFRKSDMPEEWQLKYEKVKVWASAPNSFGNQICSDYLTEEEGTSRRNIYFS